MRVRDITTTTLDETRASIAEFFGLTYDEVQPHEVKGGYAININEDEAAQAIYKEMNPYGNSTRPGKFDFAQENLVRWDSESKVAKVLF